jgi:hypothetical protein
MTNNLLPLPNNLPPQLSQLPPFPDTGHTLQIPTATTDFATNLAIAITNIFDAVYNHLGNNLDIYFMTITILLTIINILWGFVDAIIDTFTDFIFGAGTLAGGIVSNTSDLIQTIIIDGLQAIMSILMVIYWADFDWTGFPQTTRVILVIIIIISYLCQVGLKIIAFFPISIVNWIDTAVSTFLELFVDSWIGYLAIM